MNKIYKQEAEKLGWNVHEYENGGVEFENWSPKGENLIVPANVEHIEDDVAAYAENFDPEEHAAELVPMRGQNGVPGSIRAIVDDALDIAELLDNLAKAMRAADPDLEEEDEAEKESEVDILETLGDILERLEDVLEAMAQTKVYPWMYNRTCTAQQLLREVVEEQTEEQTA